jgi:hypothetical protein
MGTHAWRITNNIGIQRYLCDIHMAVLEVVRRAHPTPFLWHRENSCHILVVSSSVTQTLRQPQIAVNQPTELHTIITFVPLCGCPFFACGQIPLSLSLRS